jgi:hypothetical protein
MMYGISSTQKDLTVHLRTVLLHFWTFLLRLIPLLRCRFFAVFDKETQPIRNWLRTSSSEFELLGAPEVSFGTGRLVAGAGESVPLLLSIVYSLLTFLPNFFSLVIFDREVDVDDSIFDATNGNDDLATTMRAEIRETKV